MIGIIVALNSESKNYLDKIEDKKHLKIAGKDFYTFTLFGKEIVYAISGIGKVNASMTAQAMIRCQRFVNSQQVKKVKFL